MTGALCCPVCARTVPYDAGLVGKTIACPFCSAHFTTRRDGELLVAESAPPPPAAPAAPIRFTFTCTRCDSILECRSDQSGGTGRCPTCGAVFIIPHGDPRTGLLMDSVQIADDGQLPTPVHAYAAAGDKAPRIKREADGTPYIECPRCQARMPIHANICSACGIPFTIEGAARSVPTTERGNTAATAAVVIGALGVPFIILGFAIGPIAVILGLLGLRDVSKSSGRRRGGRWTALIGIIFGVVELVVGTLLLWR